jgi:excisionase family DNA binding protein
MAPRGAGVAVKQKNGSGPLAHRDPRALLTGDEVAARLRVTKCWVYAEVRAGRLPHVRLGRYIRFRAGAIDSWIEQIERGGSRANGNR